MSTTVRVVAALAAAVVFGVLCGAPGAAAAVAPQPYPLAGARITGGDSAVDGPLLRPGQYLDTLARGSATTGIGGSSRYYTMQLRRGDTPYVSATLVPAQVRSGDTTLQVQVEVSDLENSVGCSFDAYNTSFSIEDRVSELSAVAVSPQLGSRQWPADCPDHGTFAVRVTRSGTAFNSRPMPVELGLHIEPPATTTGLPAAATPQAYVQPRVNGSTRRITGGLSYDDAPVLRPGRYRDTIVAGETHYLRVHLAWGQRLSYLIASAAVGNHDYEDAGDATVSVANPLRQEVDQADGGQSRVYSFGGDDDSAYGSTLVPVRYANRTSDDSDIAPYAIDGDYFLVLSTDFVPKGSAAFRIPYTIAIDTIGTAEQGPTYRIATGGTAKTPPARQASKSSDGRFVVPLAAALAALLVAASGVALVVRRRRRRPVAPMAPVPTAVLTAAPTPQSYGAPAPPPPPPPRSGRRRRR